MEKDAAFASFISRAATKMAPKLMQGKFVQGLKSFAQRPFSTTARKVFWTRAKPGEIGKNVRSELGFGVKWGGGLAAAGTLASPAFVKRPI